jgi:hypothetical protein
MDIHWLRSRPAPEDDLYAVDNATLVVDGAAGLADLGERLHGARCLVVDLTRASDLSPDGAATLDEALACVRGRLTPMPTIRVLEHPQAA